MTCRSRLEARKQARRVGAGGRRRSEQLAAVVLLLAVCVTAGCASIGEPAPTATPLPSVTPTSLPRPTATATSRAHTGPTQLVTPGPVAIFAQQHVGKGVYQLMNILTYEFVQVTANGVHVPCAGRAGCTEYLKIGVTGYSGQTKVVMSPKQFKLVSASGTQYTPATPSQARGVVPAINLFQTTTLLPDDDGDYVTAVLVFRVPDKAGHFSLQWQGHHVATFDSTAAGKLSESR